VIEASPLAMAEYGNRDIDHRQSAPTRRLQFVDQRTPELWGLPPPAKNGDAAKVKAREPIRNAYSTPALSISA